MPCQSQYGPHSTCIHCYVLYWWLHLHKPAVYTSYSRSLFQVFFGFPLPRWPCIVVLVWQCCHSSQHASVQASSIFFFLAHPARVPGHFFSTYVIWLLNADVKLTSPGGLLLRDKWLRHFCFGKVMNMMQQYDTWTEVIHNSIEYMIYEQH